MEGRSPGYCETHQLPLDEGGECQLCRLRSIPSTPPPRAGRWLVVAFAAIVLCGAGAFAFALSSKVERAAPERGVRRGSSPVNAAVCLREPSRGAVRALPLPPPPPAKRRAEVAPAPRLAPAEAPATREVSEEEARAAFSQVRIVMYSTAWCGSCRRAREYLSFNEIPYTEYDIDYDEDAKERLAAINPRRSIPTFQIDDIVKVGFSPESLERDLNQAVAKRLTGKTR